MKLYYYEHCPFCAKVRFAIGLKKIPVTFSVVMADDSSTPISLVGKKIVPILVTEDGTAITESLDIVSYIDSVYGDPIFTGPLNSAITEWITELRTFLKFLTYPRFSRTAFAELATPEARNAYKEKETLVIGDLNVNFERSAEWTVKLNASLSQLETLLESTGACNGELSIDDVNLFAFLRNASIVKDAVWPVKVKNYLNNLSLRTNVSVFFDIAI